MEVGYGEGFPVLGEAGIAAVAGTGVGGAGGGCATQHPQAVLTGVPPARHAPHPAQRLLHQQELPGRDVAPRHPVPPQLSIVHDLHRVAHSGELGGRGSVFSIHTSSFIRWAGIFCFTQNNLTSRF